MTTATKMTFDDYADLDQRIKDLLRKVKVYAKQPEGCTLSFWYGEAKPELVTIVGWERGNGPALLKTADAYNVVYDALFEQLPVCPQCDIRH